MLNLGYEDPATLIIENTPQGDKLTLTRHPTIGFTAIVAYRGTLEVWLPMKECVIKGLYV